LKNLKTFFKIICLVSSLKREFPSSLRYRE
jgi:hypothetical protein